jgi:hypothetical protein
MSTVVEYFTKFATRQIAYKVIIGTNGIKFNKWYIT